MTNTPESPTAPAPTPVKCPYCQRTFSSTASLRDHARSKRRASAAHGLRENGEPRTRAEIQKDVSNVR